MVPVAGYWHVIRLALFAFLMAPAQERAAPSFVVILVDDLGYGDVGPFGSKRCRTPNLDRMAAEGTKLTSFYAAPLCTASRTALMTGCYAKRVGMPNVLFPAGAVGLAPAEKTIAELLKARGYATMAVGKWHLGDQPEYLPTRRGFDRYFGLPYSNDMGNNGGKGKGRPPLPLLRDEKVIEAPAVQETLTARYTDEAVRFLKENRDKPFFLYLPHTAVHVPLHPGEGFRGKSGSGALADWVEEVDGSVGRVLETLRELKLGERTLVLFTSDNGGPNAASNVPLRGTKGSTWEGGMRVPTIAWGPGRIPAGRSCDEVAATIDLLPTLVKLSGGEVPADRAIDGKDIAPLLLGQAGAKSPHEAFCYFKGDALEAVRSGRWKFRLADRSLYDLDADIGEKSDVAAANPDVLRRLQGFADRMDADLGLQKRGPGCRPAARVASPRPLALEK